MTLLLVRHAEAGHRGDWDGDDELRPVDERGRRQAEGLVAALARLRPERILSSPAVRCTQTVEPLATELGLPLEETEDLAEGAGPERVLALARGLEGVVAVLCTHGDVVEDLLGEESEKGSIWALELGADGLIRREYVPPPA
jgi:phosphohistidine phosphatase SixA